MPLGQRNRLLGRRGRELSNASDGQPEGEGDLPLGEAVLEQELHPEREFFARAIGELLELFLEGTGRIEVADRSAGELGSHDDVDVVEICAGDLRDLITYAGVSIGQTNARDLDLRQSVTAQEPPPSDLPGDEGQRGIHESSRLSASTNHAAAWRCPPDADGLMTLAVPHSSA